MSKRYQKIKLRTHNTINVIHFVQINVDQVIYKSDTLKLSNSGPKKEKN